MSSGQAVVVPSPLSDGVHRRFNRGPRPALAGAGEEMGLRTLEFQLSRAEREDRHFSGGGLATAGKLTERVVCLALGP